MRFHIICLALLAAVCLALPAYAQLEADPSVSITDFYAYDPMLGKQSPLATFNWPQHRQLGVAVRFETEGYLRRKTVQIFFVLSDRSDKVILKEERELNLHSGEHEFALPLGVEIGELFGETRFKLDVEVKLVGANRATERIEAVVNGSAAAAVTIADLRLQNPEDGSALSSLSAGQAFRLVGTVSVSGNESSLLPSFAVWGLMNGDKLEFELYEMQPFSDMYWDSLDLPSKNGKWRFALEGLMPTHFLPNVVESQPFTLSCAVAFSPEAVYSETLSGTVLASGSGALVSEDMDERLIFIERNWHWDLEKMN